MAASNYLERLKTIAYVLCLEMPHWVCEFDGICMVNVELIFGARLLAVNSDVAAVCRPMGVTWRKNHVGKGRRLMRHYARPGTRNRKASEDISTLGIREVSRYNVTYISVAPESYQGVWREWFVGIGAAVTYDIRIELPRRCPALTLSAMIYFNASKPRDTPINRPLAPLTAVLTKPGQYVFVSLLFNVSSSRSLSRSLLAVELC